MASTVRKNVIPIAGATEAKKGKVGAIEREVVIQPPKFEIAAIAIRGASPYVQHKFAQKAVNTMIENQKKGSVTRKGQKRDPKDFDAVYKAATHRAREGWYGLPAAAFRNAAISACRTVGFRMTIAKLSLFVEADGYDEDGTALVRFTKGEPFPHFAPARNDNGSTDIRCRPMWKEGWEAKVRVRWDADQFTATDVFNLFARIGLQVGIGEGRPDSKKSAGLGWGLFEVVA